MTVWKGPHLTFSLLGTTPSLLDMVLLYNITLFEILHDLIEAESFTAGCPFWCKPVGRWGNYWSIISNQMFCSDYFTLFKSLYLFSFIFTTSFFFPLIPIFLKYGNQLPGIHWEVLVKCVHTCTLFMKKSQHTFGFGTFCFFCDGENMWQVLLPKGSFTCYHKKCYGIEFWSNPCHVYFLQCQSCCGTWMAEGDEVWG